MHGGVKPPPRSPIWVLFQEVNTNKVLPHLVSVQQWSCKVMLAWMATKERGILHLSPKKIGKGFPSVGVTLPHGCDSYQLS